MGLGRLGPIGSTGPPGSVKPTGSGLGRSTDPAQPPHAPLSPLELTGDTQVAAAVACRFRPTPASFTAATLGEALPSSPSLAATK
jgi:hypothetical protein